MSHESVQFVCPACGEAFLVTPQAVGHRVRCPRCDAIAEVQPSLFAGRGDLQQSRELAGTPGEEPVNTTILEPSAGRGEAPPSERGEPEAPPVMRPPLARPPVPPPVETAVQEKELPADGRLPKRDKLVAQESEMDMTPMVDCVFQLLIFFMLTASFAVQKSLLVPKPTLDDPGTSVVEPKEENLEAVTVRVDAQNNYFVSGGGLGEDEVEAPSPGELIMKLKQARHPGPDGRIPNKLMVMANGEALHHRVVAAIDAGNDVGMEEVGLKTVEDEDQ